MSTSVLGIRAEPRAVHWAVVRGTSEKPVLHAHGTEAVPNAYTETEGLAWLRTRLIYVADTYRPAKAAVRLAERTAKGSNTDAAKSRCRVEGVVLEVAGSKNLETVAGRLKTFAKHSECASPKEDLSSDNLRGLDWAKYGGKLQEAIYVAFSLLPK